MCGDDTSYPRRTGSALALLHPAETHRCYDARPDPAHVSNFEAFQKRVFGEATEKTCQNTSPDEERRLSDKILDMPSPGIAQCAANVSDVLDGSPNFPNVRGGTLLPGNLFRDAGGR